MFTNHIGLKIRNIEKSQNFYCENLDFVFENKYESDSAIILFLKNKNSVIELIQSKDNVYTSVNHGIISHLAFTVTDIHQHIDKLKKNNVQFTQNEVKEFNGKLIIFFEGPDGEKLELLQYINS